MCVYVLPVLRVQKGTMETARFDEPIAAYLFKQVMVRRINIVCLYICMLSLNRSYRYPHINVQQHVSVHTIQVTVNKLHKDGIFHRDIKLENFLVAREEGQYQLKVGAPGMSSSVCVAEIDS